MKNISAMILAAGRGERMRPLSDVTPKPLLQVRGKPLMQWPMQALANAGFDRLVINTAWLGAQIEACFGAQPAWDERIEIAYSHEGRDFGDALETAGGIARALPLLSDVFWVLAGDVFAPEFEFSHEAVQRFIASGRLAHLWLVPNPAHNPQGDFGLAPDGLALNQAEQRYTYSTIGLYRKELFDDLPYGNPQGVKAALAPLLRAAIGQKQISAEIYRGMWTDVGTPQRLQDLNVASPLA